MTWQEKMDVIIKRHFAPYWSCNVLNDHKFEIIHPSYGVVVTRETIHDLASHWKSELYEAILSYYKQKLTETFNNTLV